MRTSIVFKSVITVRSDASEVGFPSSMKFTCHEVQAFNETWDRLGRDRMVVEYIITCAYHH
jgi:hypothetical protein